MIKPPFSLVIDEFEREFSFPSWIPVQENVKVSNELDEWNLAITHEKGFRRPVYYLLVSIFIDSVENAVREEGCGFKTKNSHALSKLFFRQEVFEMGKFVESGIELCSATQCILPRFQVDDVIFSEAEIFSADEQFLIANARQASLSFAATSTRH